VQISGNAPLAWYKNDADPSSKKVRKYADVLLLIKSIFSNRFFSTKLNI